MLSPSELRLRLSNAAFAVTFTLLLLLTGWWGVLLSRLLHDNYVLEVAFRGETAELVAEHGRRRVMLLGEMAVLMCSSLALVALAHRYATSEQKQIKRLEGLLAASTHELKTPVAGVRALLESLESGVLPPDRMGPHLARGLDSISRLEHLIEGILAYQSAVGRAQPDLKNFGLAALVKEVVYHRMDEAPGEEVELDLGAEVEVRGSPDGVRVILENLLDNARKYGGGKPVRVRVRSEGGVGLLQVSDQGEGFLQSDAEVMFEPYERGSAGQKRHGTGLGLYIARTLARAMGGALGATSEGAGKGATFTLTLRRPVGG